MRYLVTLIILFLFVGLVVAETKTLRFDTFKGVNTFLHETKIGDNEATDCRDFFVDEGILERRNGFWKYADTEIETLGGVWGMVWIDGEFLILRQSGHLVLGGDTTVFTVDMFPNEDLSIQWHQDDVIHYYNLWDLNNVEWNCWGADGKIHTVGDNIEDKFSLTMPSAHLLTNDDTIDSIEARASGKSSNATTTGHLRFIITSGSTEDTSAQFTWGSTLTTSTNVWSTNPDDAGAWARSDLEDLQLHILADSVHGAGCVMDGMLWIRAYVTRAFDVGDSLFTSWPPYFSQMEEDWIISTRQDIPIMYNPYANDIDTLGNVIWSNATMYIQPGSLAVYDSSQSFGIYDFNSAFYEDLDSGWVVPIVSNSTHRLSILNTLPMNGDSMLTTYKIFCRPARTENLDTGTVVAATESSLVHASAFTSGAYDNNTYYCEITAGPGLGQVHHIWRNGADTLIVGYNWLITPTSASKYAIFQRVMPRGAVAYWQDCLFASGVYYKNRIYFSDPDDPEYFFIDYYLDAPGSRQDSILALGASQYLPDQSSDDIKGLWVFQNHSISMIVGTSPNFQIRIIADNINFIAPKSLVFIGDTPFYLGSDGVYAGVQRISQKVKLYTDRMNKGKAYLSAGGYWNGHYFLSIPDSASDTPNLTLVYNVDTREWGCPLSFGFTDYLTVLDDSLYLYMASLSSPHIFQYGETDDTGQSFVPYWTSKRFNFSPYTAYINRGFMSFDNDSGMVKILVYEGETLTDSLTCLAEGFSDTVKYLGDKLINTSFQFKVTQDTNIDTLIVDNFGFFYTIRGIE